MQNKVTELVFILDKSGSMSGMEQDTIGGFNAMIEKQRALEGQVYVSTILFSSRSKILHDRKSLDKITPLTEKDYEVGGMTALLDAVGSAIKHVEKIHKYARKDDVPAHTMFVITTDGMENASRKFTSDEIKEMICEKEQECGWEFLFVAANIDAVESAESIGIRRERAVNYSVEEETVEMFEELGDRICECRVFGAPIMCAEDMERNIRQRKKGKK